MDYTIPAIFGICLIGIGGSVVKPCVAGTVQKTAGLRATLAFGIFYMVINIGSITGRSISYFVRTKLGIPAIFRYPRCALLGLFVVLFRAEERAVRQRQQEGQPEVGRSDPGSPSWASSPSSAT